MRGNTRSEDELMQQGRMAEAQQLLRMGCSELDMVINIGLLRSGRHQRVLDDIRGVVDVAGDAPVKVILECHYLSPDQIRAGCGTHLGRSL